MGEKNISMRFNPGEPEELDKIIRGSYDDFVRLERRNLLATSTTILISFYGKIEPNHASLSGFGFPHIGARMLFEILLFICLYFLIAYMIYAYPGFRDAMKKWKAIKYKAMTITGNKHRFSIEWRNILSSARYILWLVFNYGLPVISGVIALAIAACEIA